MERTMIEKSSLPLTIKGENALTVSIFMGKVGEFTS